MIHTFSFNQEKQTYFILRSELATEYARKFCFIVLFVCCLVWFYFFLTKKKIKKKKVEKVEANMFDSWWTEFIFLLLGAKTRWEIRTAKLGLLDPLGVSSTDKVVVHKSLFILWCSESKVWALGAHLALRLPRHSWLSSWHVSWYHILRSMEACRALTQGSTCRLTALETLVSLWLQPSTYILIKQGWTCVWALFSNHLYC